MSNSTSILQARLRRTVLLPFCVLGLAACAGIDMADRLAFTELENVQTLAGQQPELEGPLSLNDALARGLIYNLSFHKQRNKAFQALEEVGLSRGEYLPRVSAYAEASRRSNVDAAVGQRVTEMDEDLPTDFFTASDQARAFGNITATWSLIDFGLSYLENEKQKRWAENEHYVTQISCAGLAGDIVEGHWRARAFERAEAKNDWLRWRIETGLDVSRQRAEANPESRTDELFLQREIIDLFRWYDSIYQSLAGSKAQLAGLINLPAGTDFEIAVDQNVSYLHDLPTETLSLVEIAFQNRPELRQRALFDEINRLSDRQGFIRQFPNLSLFLGAEGDSNSFLLNNNFTRVGANLSWNLFELANRSDRRRQQANRAEQFELENQLVASAIIAQVALSMSEYQARDQSLTYAWRANTIQAEIVDRVSASFAKGEAPESHVVKEELLRELSILRRDVDEAGHQAARIRVLNALGLGPDCSALPLEAGYDAVRSALSVSTAPRRPEPA